MVHKIYMNTAGEVRWFFAQGDRGWYTTGLAKKISLLKIVDDALRQLGSTITSLNHVFVKKKPISMFQFSDLKSYLAPR